jgi:sarcosine oxidase subunit gamma
MVDIARRHLPAPRPGTHWSAAPALARFSLRANFPTLASAAATLLPVAEEPCRSVQRGEWSALWLGPDEQLLIGPESQSVQFARAVDEALGGTAHSLVDVSHRQSGLEIHGPHVIDLLNAGCPLDLELDRFPIGACTRTVMAKAEIVLWRRANEQFHIEVWRSFVSYLSEFLAAVEQEFLGEK